MQVIEAIRARLEKTDIAEPTSDDRETVEKGEETKKMEVLKKVLLVNDTLSKKARENKMRGIEVQVMELRKNLAPHPSAEEDIKYRKELH
ncbi:hypothetical protein JTB14_009956 [Gonioctena quinquepunctata]|nr:hypothetical protein JTB14_009956 [Gonioctena quinquepunctata]